MAARPIRPRVSRPVDDGATFCDNVMGEEIGDQYTVPRSRAGPRRHHEEDFDADFVPATAPAVHPAGATMPVAAAVGAGGGFMDTVADHKFTLIILVVVIIIIAIFAWYVSDKKQNGKLQDDMEAMRAAQYAREMQALQAAQNAQEQCPDGVCPRPADNEQPPATEAQPSTASTKEKIKAAMARNKAAADGGGSALPNESEIAGLMNQTPA